MEWRSICRPNPSRSSTPAAIAPPGISVTPYGSSLNTGETPVNVGADREFVGASEAINGGLIEGPSDELKPDGQARCGGAAGHREAGKTVQVGRSREAREGR